MSGILVSGATTPIGEGLVRTLVANDSVTSILAVGAEPPERAGALTTLPRVTYRQVDLVRARRVRQLLFGAARDLDIRTVVHLALHRRATDDGSRVHRLNVDATRELLYLCEAHPTIHRFVLRSYGEVYAVRANQPSLISEEHPVDLSPGAPQWIRDRVEADLTVCTRMGVGPLEVLVLRCAECLAGDCGSQMHDYLESRVCLRPMGFDPMLNLLSQRDLIEALRLAAISRRTGIYNIAGADTLPLSEVITRWGRTGLPTPSPLLAPLYRLRSSILGADFRYDLNAWRFHFSGVLDGRRARKELGYEAKNPISWPLR